MARRTEPFTPRQVEHYLHVNGFTRTRQTGSHTFWVHQDGRRVPCIDSGSNATIDAVLGKKIADALGLSISELRQLFGYTQTNAQSSRKRATSAGWSYSGPNVHDLVVGMSRTLMAIDTDGACFHAADTQRANLQELASRLDQWHARNKGKAVK